jgi:hypothetical protein
MKLFHTIYDVVDLSCCSPFACNDKQLSSLYYYVWHCKLLMICGLGLGTLNKWQKLSIFPAKKPNPLHILKPKREKNPALKNKNLECKLLPHFFAAPAQIYLPWISSLRQIHPTLCLPLLDCGTWFARLTASWQTSILRWQHHDYKIQ